jgi:hypothetical protein
MTRSVPERIADNVEAALRTIRVVNGYRFNGTVETVAAATNTPTGDVFMLVSQQEPSLADESPINLDDYEVVHNVAYRRVVREADINRTPDALHAEVLGEIRRAIMADEKLGNLAIRTYDFSHVKGRTEGSGAVEGEVSFTSLFRTVQDDMFASAFE